MGKLIYKHDRGEGSDAMPTNAHSQTPVSIPGYRLGETLYSGAKTRVYRGLRLTDEQPVAIKIPQQDYPTFNELLQFRNQYAIARYLDIPGIVRPYSLETYRSSYALIVEDFGGVSLRDYASQNSLSLAQILEIALQVAEILHDLHARKVIHKDIKPANLLIHPVTHQVKLIDFSIASLLLKETQEIENPNGLEGTLAYIAPEQTGRMNRAIDYRSDLYSLGVTLFELFTGRLPFESKDPLELVHCHIAQQPPSLVEFALPEALANIVAKLMAKNAEDRYQSALGLKLDLEQCRERLTATGKIEPFAIGTRDLCDRFRIPEKLYGREKEVSQLLAAFERVAEGATEIMLVAGFSGIGKTAAINEIHKPVTRQKGYFIKGKFDQFNRNIPLSAFVQAFRDLMRQLLWESDEKLQTWKTRILNAVGENGQLLLEVIPELEQIIDRQPPVSELSGIAAQNRFNALFQKFVALFTQPEHPLVIFLDDLQWADLASLNLLAFLMKEARAGYLLILSAYRDNEVNSAHPALLTVAELKKAKAIVNTIALLPLAFNDTNRLIADTLNCSPELAKPLTEQVARKTQGNPFFTVQFLKTLYEEGYLRFESARCYWECDLDRVKSLALTDDVVEFMAQQLRKLPPETQQVLKLGACIGNSFDLSTLAIVSQQSEEQAAFDLWSALPEGLILPINPVYKFYQERGEERPSDREKAAPKPNPAKYRFLHDRVQQAAYSLMDDEQKQRTHYQIGQLLLNNLSPSEQEEWLFDIVNQMNFGRALLEGTDELVKLARLNLAAGQKAQLSIAYQAAIDYFRTGISLVGARGWSDCYNLTLALHRHLAQTQLSYSQFQDLETTATTILERVTDAVERADIYVLQVTQYTMQGQFQEAIDRALMGLQELGIDLDFARLAEANQAEFIAIEKRLKERPLASVLALPLATEPSIRAAIKLLIAIDPPSYITAQLETYTFISLKAVRLSLEYGNVPESIKAYANYGLLLNLIQQQYQRGYEFGNLAVQLSHNLKSRSQQCKACLLLGGWIQVWAKPIAGAATLNSEGFLAGIDSGEVEFAGYNLFGNVYNRLFQGENLQGIAPDLEKFWTIAQNQQNELLRIAIAGARCFIVQLQPLERESTQQEFFCEGELIDRARASKSWFSLCLHYVLQMQLACINGTFERGLDCLTEARKILDAIAGFTTYGSYFYFASLILLNQSSPPNATQQAERLEQVRDYQNRIKAWADSCPENFLHKYCLIEAERHRLLGNKAAAIEYYDRAIAEAKANHFIQEESLANELAAKFYLDWHKEKVAAGYLQEAYYGYARWGASAKVRDLEQRYPQRLAPLWQQQRTPLSVADTLSSTADPTLVSLSSSTLSTSVSANLDLATVLKASQTLSSEIQLERLLAALLDTVLENSGADRGALLMPRASQWFIEAMVSLEASERVESIPLERSHEIPHTAINHVKRTRQALVIADATLHPTLSADDYILQQQPKSLLCTPILQQGQLVAILYLENRVAAGAFTRERVELLNLLCAQAAISLENARLYRQAQDYAQQLEQSQLQLIQSEKMSALGNLVAGVAHEINNPVGCVLGNVDAVQEYFDDLFGLLELYRQECPQPSPALKNALAAVDLDYLRQDAPELIRAMQDGGERISAISMSLRTFSRSDCDTPQPFDLHEGIESTLLILRHRLKANEKRPAIEVVADYGELPEIACFPGQLNQVFMNILANAIDAIEETNAGRSYTEIEANPNRITLRTRLAKGEVKIAIADNGTGMLPEVKARIFEHLFTTKGVGKGTGLGLAIARQIVEEKHGGKLEVRSQFGQGTQFFIRLPIAESE